MQVGQILKMKGDASVVTVTPQSSLEDAVKTLSEKRIGALVVSEDGERLAGILSERDIVRALGRRGTQVLKGNVADLMTQKVTTCAPGDANHVVLTQMTEGRFRHVPVVEEGRLIGLISIGDVVKARLSELAMERDALQGMVMGH